MLNQLKVVEEGLVIQSTLTIQFYHKTFVVILIMRTKREILYQLRRADYISMKAPRKLFHKTYEKTILV